MDYEFKKNMFDGQYLCRCSMGHEIIGRWLQEEIGTDSIKINRVFELIEQAKIHSVQEHKLLGREVTMLICGDEVMVQENTLTHPIAADDLEELAVYDCESAGCCGIEDFEQLMMQWREFVNH